MWNRARHPLRGTPTEGELQAAKPKVLDTVKVDLDFWTSGQVHLDFLKSVVRRVGRQNNAAAIEHEKILPHLKRFDGDRGILINLDPLPHSDPRSCQ
jgi:hypothetical protein